MSFCVLLLIVIIVSMVYFVASKGIANFVSGEVKVSDFLFGTKWSPEADTPSYGAFPFIAGSFLVTLLAALIASPLSICAALFMTEIVPGWGKKLLQPVIELLSGIPSVVYGFVGLSVIVPFLRNTLPGQGIGVAAGALVLSVMILPTITSVAADALASLPQNLKESSFALGATRWQTISRVILPTTFPAIMTGWYWGWPVHSVKHLLYRWLSVMRLLCRVRCSNPRLL